MSKCPTCDQNRANADCGPCMAQKVLDTSDSWRERAMEAEKVIQGTFRVPAAIYSALNDYMNAILMTDRYSNENRKKAHHELKTALIQNEMKNIFINQPNSEPNQPFVNGKQGPIKAGDKVILRGTVVSVGGFKDSVFVECDQFGDPVQMPPFCVEIEKE